MQVKNLAYVSLGGYKMNTLMHLVLAASLCNTLSGGTQIGVTHTQHSLDPWDDAEAVARAEDLLSSGAIQFQVSLST